jgi:hypothetical protein
MTKKKTAPQRRSLMDRIDAAIAEDDFTPVAGITPKAMSESVVEEPQQATQAAPVPDPAALEPLRTKKATTIMPKEVFNALQRYCTESDTPKHRAVYLFIIDGLHRAAAITDEEYQRYRDMANLLTTTYEKK